MSFPAPRPRRMRRTPALRALVRETELVAGASDRAALREGGHRRAGRHRLDARAVPAHARVPAQGSGRDRRARRRAFMLFGVPVRKDAEGSEAWNPTGIGQQAIAALRTELGDDARGDGRPLPGRVHRPRPLRRADRRRRRRQRRDPGAVPAHRDRAGGGGSPPGRAERHDGRSGGRDPRRAGRRRAHGRRDHGVRGEVRERVLRAVPRSRRVRAAASAIAPATRWTPPTPTKRSARSAPTSTKAPTS